MTGLPVAQNLTVYRGDTWAQTFRFLRNGEPVDLTNATVEAEARAAFPGVEQLNGAAVSGTPKASLVVTIEDATDGRISLKLPPESLPSASYVYDIEVTDDEDVVTTWVKGSLTVVRDITNELPIT